jgi:quinol monooxygenase YgiN
LEKVALFVDVKTAPGQRDAFVNRVKKHGELCLSTEPGCLRFEVLIPYDDANRVLLWEVYADDAALAAHDASEHMTAYREDVSSMILSRVRTHAKIV